MRSSGLIRLGRGRFARPVALVTAFTIVTGLLGIPAAEGRPAGASYKPVDRDKVVDGHALKVEPRKRDRSVTHPAPSAKVVWPSPTTAEAAVPVGGERAAAIRVGNSPVWVEAPGKGSRARAGTDVAQKVQVRILDRKTTERVGVDGVLFTVGRTDAASGGVVGVRLDYAGFGQAFGGSYGSRLRLVRLPVCALTTPEKPECQTVTSLRTTNNTETRTLSADVDAAPVSAPAAMTGQATVLAAVAGPAGDKGDFKATSLQSSSSWQISAQTGDFSWSYPMRVPPVTGGLMPPLGIGYSSSSIDGRTSNNNGQPSWVGDGFDLWPGYIQRAYKPCEDDGAPKDEYGNSPGDQCWGYDNAVLTLNGKGGELVPMGGDKWRLRIDDGTRVQKLHGNDTDTANGDDDNEYWKVTTPDGTQYFFGKNRLNNWASGKPETKSTWIAPVFGDDDNEPCHKSTGFKDSWCQQGYRWNLDYVVDIHGNAITYYYNREGNYYGRNLEAKNGTIYTRGGWLDRIEYGLDKDNLWPAKVPAKVDFEVSERCVREDPADCAEGNIKDHPDYWWDVPWDLNCESGQECKEDHGGLAPTFWSRKRLAKITTSVINKEGTGYRTVDSWKLKHAWGMADVDRQLLLESVTNTGEAGAVPVATPPVSFVYKQLPNRVDKLGDDVGPFVKNRLATIYNEAGGVLDINYTDADCTTADLPNPADNHRRCFPVYWTNGTNGGEPALDWFHKYAAVQTVQTDLTGKSPDQVTDYDYSDGKPSWHFDDDQGLTREKYKTWSQWHGFGRVRITKRNPLGTASRSEHWYFQGMDGDRADRSGNTKKQVSVSDGEGNSYPDHDALQGMEIRSVTYDRPGGAAVAKTVTSPWKFQTASKSHSWGTLTAHHVGLKSTRAFTALDGGKWRETKTTNVDFDEATGQPTQIENLGDVSVDDDDRCTTTTLVHNVDIGLLALPAQVRTVAAKCGAAVDFTKQLVSDTRTYYDNGAFKATPTRGLVTQTDKVATSGTTAETVRYVPATRAKYDAYGRPLISTTVDNTTGVAVNKETKNGYTDLYGLTVGVSTTSPPANPADPNSTQTTSEEFDPAWGAPIKKTDAAGQVTSLEYDAAGRLIKVWQPDQIGRPTPSFEFEYRMELNKVVAVATKTLDKNGDQVTGWELFDGWFRTRQTQIPGPDGGRLITDRFYNAQGRVDRDYDAYYADGAPGTTLFGVDQVGDVESQLVNEYDGVGRVSAKRLLIGNSDAQEAFRVRYAYGGDHITVTPPDGGTPATTVFDAQGRTVELKQHRANPPGGVASTKYTYNRLGQLEKVVAHGGHTWTYGYDIRGRKTSSTDPDSGTTRVSYDDLDQAVLAENAKGEKIASVYDTLGRKIEQRTGSPTGAKLAEWTYDTVRKGQLASATRFDGTATYTTKINFYDTLYRPTSTTIKLTGFPAAEASLAPTNGYTFTTSYNNDGSVRTQGMPGAGGLGGESIAYTYDDFGRATKSKSNLSSYVIGTDYSKTGKLIGQRLGTSDTGKLTSQSFTYEFGTQRLESITTVHDGQAGVDRKATYKYKDAGNVTQITDSSRDGVDNQCFLYDDLQRLTDAWTQEVPSGGTQACAANPQGATLGGPAPYRVNYTYDETGNRKTETQYGSTDQVISSRSYRYANGEGVDPKYKGHQLADLTQTGLNAHTESYEYDVTGNTTTRKTGTASQTLTWDAEGNLTKVADPKNGDTSYAYSADGSRLLRRDPTGTSLYLPGTEIRLDKGSTTPKAARYYTHNGQTVAMRTSAGVTILATDAQGTAQLAINPVDGTSSTRRYLPFGGMRASKNAWPTADSRGFLGGVNDTSVGLTHLGAREYDTTTGRFISVDPMIDPNNPQQMNGYTYANNNPTTYSDPDGQFLFPLLLLLGLLGLLGGAGQDSGSGGGRGGGGNAGGPGAGAPAPQPPLEPAPTPSPDPGELANRCYIGMSSGLGGGCPGDIVQNRGGLVSDMYYLNDFAARGWKPGGTAPYNWKEQAKFYAFGLMFLVAGPEDLVAMGGWKTLSWLARTKYIERGIERLSKLFKLGGKKTPNKPGTGTTPGTEGSPHVPDGTPHKPDGGPTTSPSGSKGCSFVPGTDVVMADGTRTPIERVRVGDRVLATDPKTGKTVARAVVDTIVGADLKNLVQVTVTPPPKRASKVKSMGQSKEDRAGVVVATGNHPFWIVTLRKWLPAAELKPGMWLRTSAGTHVQVSAIRTWVQFRQVYNLTIKTDHTFYVGVGTTDVLTHNSGPKDLCDPPDHPPRKTVANSNGTWTISGWDNDVPKPFVRASLKDILAVQNSIGKDRVPHFMDNSAGPGAYYLSHAEKHAYTLNPGAPITVYRDMCDDCFQFFIDLGRSGRKQEVTDPQGTYLFGSSP